MKELNFFLEENNKGNGEYGVKHSKTQKHSLKE
jgi:hypothetical protein